MPSQLCGPRGFVVPCRGDFLFGVSIGSLCGLLRKGGPYERTMEIRGAGEAFECEIG